ncbi:DUF2252 domain-containing protein [Mycolicibacterium sp.]|uniref:DUF2252 domain-containing protein n=1 Tax=Mycolicibacterium sp. TaxID=2320850 RepID=UPI001A305A04|nr:DUF2252 domain-containing protein [Mycolicibacterium sp.]MBJ7338973.1 DUF2252 domain-containing protein [Mycolicibacterium sp.]
MSPLSNLSRRDEDGRAARKVVPRRGLGIWDPAARGHDALATIVAQNEIRAQELLPIRHGRMAASPWTYFRGAAAVMAADLASTPNTGITVQLCGDAHVLNFGLWNTPERNVSFDLRDFDETLPGPFEWDLKRLAASLVVLARAHRLTESVGRQSVSSAFRGYSGRMKRYAPMPEIDIWYDRIVVDDLIQDLAPYDANEVGSHLESQLRKRTSRGASKKLTAVVDGRRRIVEDPPFRTHAFGEADADPDEIFLAYRDSLPDHVWSLLTRFDLADSVRQVVGVGSVGMRVYLILLEERRTRDPFFLQIKQAGPSVYEQFVESSEYAHHGQRVINGQRLIQSSTDMFVGWTTIEGNDYYVRQFRDGKVIPTGEAIADRLPDFAGVCGQVLARAHARSGDAAAIAGYLGAGNRVETALVDFACAYADQNERDHRQFAAAVDDGSLPSALGWN